MHSKAVPPKKVSAELLLWSSNTASTTAATSHRHSGFTAHKTMREINICKYDYFGTFSVLNEPLHTPLHSIPAGTDVARRTGSFSPPAKQVIRGRKNSYWNDSHFQLWWPSDWPSDAHLKGCRPWSGTKPLNREFSPMSSFLPATRLCSQIGGKWMFTTLVNRCYLVT